MMDGKEIIQVMGHMTVQRVTGDIIFASRGYKVFRSSDGGNRWEADGHIPVRFWRKIISPVAAFRRISRSGIYFVLPQSDGSRLCVISKMIVRAESGSPVYRPVFQFSKGSRPLNLCQSPDGNIYWGEYFLNLTRSEPVRIFCSGDGGKKWETVFTFPKRAICHVHRIVYDPFDRAILVCTGDRDSEAAILKTADGFRTLEPLVRGEQRFRTTSLIPLRQGILYGTDNPVGKNYIMHLDRVKGLADRIQEVRGPVLYGSRAGEYAVFATMVEKKNHEVEIWAGNEKAFRLVAGFKTRKMNQVWREIVGYSTVVLPDGTGSWPDLYCTPVGTVRYADDLIKIDMKEWEFHMVTGR